MQAHPEPHAPPTNALSPHHTQAQARNRKPGDGTPSPLVYMWPSDKINKFDLNTMAFQIRTT